jgi:transcriptional regulator
MLLPMNEKGFSFWTLRRSGVSNITIAQQLGISRQAVSHALLAMDEKVETALVEMAKANQIAIERVNPERGILLGRSVPFAANAIIFVSGKHGVQVWYEHDGDCGTCQRYTECIELLWDYADELGIRIQKTADPTAMATELFEKVRAMALS